MSKSFKIKEHQSLNLGNGDNNPSHRIRKQTCASDWQILKHSTRREARYLIRPLLSVPWDPSLCELGLGPESVASPLPSIIHPCQCWSYFASKLHKCKPTLISSLTPLMFNHIFQHTPLSDHIRFFSTLHTLLGGQRAWTMTIYQHDLWFVSRFEGKMLIFQASSLNSFQTET